MIWGDIGLSERTGDDGRRNDAKLDRRPRSDCTTRVLETQIAE